MQYFANTMLPNVLWLIVIWPTDIWPTDIWPADIWLADIRPNILVDREICLMQYLANRHMTGINLADRHLVDTI